MVAKVFCTSLGSVTVAAAIAVGSLSAALAAEYPSTLQWSGLQQLHAGVSGVVELPGLVPGAEVAAGEQLVAISSAYYDASLTAARRGAELARGELELAEQAFERNEVLFEDGSMSLVEFDVAKIDLERARARAATAEAALVSARSQAGRARIKAVHDVVVLDVAVHDGDYVESSLAPAVLMTVARSTGFEAAVSVDPEVRREVSLGQAVRVRVADRELAGQVAWIRGLLEDGAAVHRIGVSVDAAGAALVAGMPVVLELP